GCSLRHGFSKRTLLLEQRGLSLSDQDIGPVAELLSLFHEALRRLPHRLRPESYFRGQHRAAEEMGANGFGEVLTTPRAHVRAGSVQDVGGEFRVAEADVTGRASGDDGPSSRRRPALAPPVSGRGGACSQRATNARSSIR